MPSPFRLPSPLAPEHLAHVKPGGGGGGSSLTGQPVGLLLTLTYA